jgi:hypothetical protein
MKNIILLIVILTIATSLAQDGRNPNVELPDFVITGSDVITIQRAKKIEPPIISTISEEFIKPVFNPEELDMKEPSNPLKEDLALFDPVTFRRGYLKAGAGLYSLPEASFGYTYPFASGIAGGYLNGGNYRAHEEYSDGYGFGGGVNLSLFTDNDASFLPGTHVRIKGDMGSQSFKTYGSTTDPKYKRDLITGGGEVNINNLYLDHFKFGLKAGNNFTSFSDEGNIPAIIPTSLSSTENILGLDGFARLDFKNFDLGVQSTYKYQMLSNENITTLTNSTFLGLRPTISLMVANSFKTTFGFDITNYAGKNEITPYGGVSFMLDKSLTMYALYKSGREFISAGDLVRENKYFNPFQYTNSAINRGSDLNVHVKYEYEKYFQIDAGAGIMSADNVYYYSPSAINPGLFDFASTNGKGIRGEINFLFHAGPYGILYASGMFSSLTDSANRVIPYRPSIQGEATYAYSFNNGLTTEFKLLYMSEVYADINNSRKLPSYIDLGLNFIYKLTPKFEWTLETGNLLNNGNYRWEGYKELPINVTAGLRYRW